MLEPFDDDALPPPRLSDVRDRLVALDRARPPRRRGSPDLVWLLVVLFAVVLVSLSLR